MVPQRPDGVLFSVRCPSDSHGKDCLSSYSQARTTQEMLKRAQCLPMAFCVSQNRAWACGWDMLLWTQRAQSWGLSDVGKAHDVESVYQILLQPPNVDLNFDFSVCHIARVKLSRKGNMGVIFEGAAYVYSLSCSVLGVRPQTHLSTEAKAKQSYAAIVCICRYLWKRNTS